ncbi:hypothetical protein [Burkholderia cepacia]|uniref:hypothetical protein n=1 Tax=Burkholderia cepacia TaxID=292 RepID=UPI0009C1842A|nr:hypothetical protein [Burkholderia cepacia]
MVLALFPQEEKLKLNRSVVHRGASNATHHGAVIFHLREVLSYFAREGVYDHFYIGVTNDLNARLNQHRRTDAGYTWMVPIYEEDSINVDNSFDRMEKEAITHFQGGFTDPFSGRTLTCGNKQQGASPKMYLYILVGKSQSVRP